MSRSRDYVWQIALTLQHHQIIPQVTDEIIEQACKELRGRKAYVYTTEGIPIAVLHVLLPSEPDRFVEFDTEIDNCDEAAQIIRDHARATMGEWVPASVSSSTLVASFARVIQAIDFDFREEHVHWEFTIGENGTGTHWPMDFYMQFDAFLATHLEGTFFAPFLGHQGSDGCYLPRPVVANLKAVQEMMEADFDYDGFDAFIKGL